MLVFHDKMDGASGPSTSEALVDAFGRTDNERGGFFVMKRAKPDEIHPPFGQMHKIPHHLLNAAASLIFPSQPVRLFKIANASFSSFT